jgi:HEAT repeat protein
VANPGGVGALARTGDAQALAALVAHAGHEVANYRKAAIAALGQWSHPEATAALLRSLTDPNRKVRAEAATALVGQGEAVRAALEEARGNGEYAQAKESLDMALSTLNLTRHLAEGGTVDAALTRSLARCHPSALDVVVAHLRERGTETELQAVIEACRSPRSSVAWFATQVLRKTGDKARAAIEEALLIVEDARTRDWLTHLRRDVDRDTEEAEE